MKKLFLFSVLFTISNFTFAQFPNLVASSNSPVCQGSTLSLSATHDVLAGGTTAAYSWAGPSSFTSSAQNPQRPNANIVDGTYTITLTLTGTQTGTYTATTAVTSRPTPLFTPKSYLQNDALNLTSNFCVGNNITLDSDVDYSSGVSYSWTGPNGFSSTLKTPTISNVTAANAGQYQATATFNNASCVVTIKRFYSVTIGSPRIATTQSLVCAGGNVTLTPVHLPATATVSSYLWEGPNGFTSNASPLIINNLQDRKTFKLTANFNGACAGTAIAYLSINPIVPTPSVVVSTVNCDVNVVASMPITFAPAELTNYSWTGPGGFTSNQLSAKVMQEGAYTFTGTISGAGCNDIYTKTVVVPRIPSTTSPVLGVSFSPLTEFGASQNAFCDGLNVILLSSRTGDNMTAMTFNWTGPNGFSSTLATPMITNFSAAKAGVYNLTITGIGNACSPTATGTASTSVFIGHNAAPSLTGINFFNANAPGTAFCSGSTISLNPALNANSSSSIGTYSWTGPNGFASTERIPTISNVSAVNQGVYNLTATFTSGCVGTATVSASLTLATLPSFSISQRRVKFNNSTSLTNCLGTTVELVAQTNGSIINSISWTGPNGFSSTALSPQIVNTAAVNTGYYYATIDFGGECPATITRGSLLTFSNTANLPFGINRTNTDPVSDNRSLCLGNTIRLFPSSPTNNYYEATYQWTGPNGFTSNDIAPTISNLDASKLGTYTLNATYTAGCVGTSSSSITLNTTPPSVSVGIAGNTALCAGSPLTLATNQSSLDTYSWTGPNSFTSNQSRIHIPSLSVSDIGVYSVTVNIGGSCPTTVTASFNAQFNTTPTTTTIRILDQITSLEGNAQCAGSNIQLSVNLTASQITSYSWSGPNGFSSTLANPVVNNSQVGTYSVTVGYMVCGAASTITATVALSNTKSIILAARSQGGANATSFCSGSNVELFVNAITPNYAQPNSYSWAGPNGFISTAAIPLISNAISSNAGVYTLTVNFANPCGGTVTATTSISIANFQPNLLARRPGQSNAFTFCSGTPIVEFYTSNTPSSGTISSYNWTGPNGFSSTATSPQIASFQAANAGTYSLTVTVSAGACTGTYTATTTISLGNASAFISFSGGTNLCSGGGISLFASGNQTYGAGATYSWAGPNNFSSTTANNTLVLSNLQVVNSGVYTSTVNYPSTSGCASSGTGISTISLTIGVPIVTISSRLQGSASSISSFCVGSNVELFTTFNVTSPAPTVASYSWTGPNGYSSTSAIPLISNFQAANAGAYSVTVTFSGACAGTASATRTITVGNQTVFAFARRIGQGNAYSFCAGTTVELFTSFSPVNNPIVSSYAWSGPSGFSSTAALPQIANFQTANVGTYTFSAVVSGACAGTYTTSINLGISNTVSPYISNNGNSIQCPGGSVTFFPYPSTGNFGSGSTYSWSGPNNFSSTAANPVLNNLQAVNSGTYSVTVVYPSTSGCASFSGTSTMTTKLSIGNTAANILPNQNQTAASGVGFPLNIEILGGTLPISMTLSNGANLTVNFTNGNNGNISTINTSVTSAQTITISSITSACGVGTGTGSAVITLQEICPTSATANSRIQGAGTSSTAFCTGTNVELYTTFNTTHSGATYSYNWTGPNGYSSTSATPLLNNAQPSNAGTYSVIVTFGGSCTGTATATRTITVANTTLFALARRIGQGNAYSFCVGTTVELFTSFTPSNPTVSSYSWSGPNGFSSTDALPQIASFQATNVGQYTLSAVVSGACAGTYTASISLGISNAVSPYIALSGNSVQCPGGSLTLFSLPSTGNFAFGSAYSWSGPNNFSSTQEFPVLNNLQAVNSGTYTLTVVYPSTSGCASFSGTSTMTTKLSVGNTAANILPNQNQTAASGVGFPLNFEILGGTLPISMTLSNGSSHTISFTNGNTGNIFTPNINVTSAQTITISSISSSCGVGTGTGSAVISIGTPCPPTLTNYSVTINNGNTLYREVSGDITTQTITVNSGGKLTLDSGKSILLQPGFEAKNGSVFRAFIDGCGNITN